MNINWKILGKAILSVVKSIAFIAIGIVFLFGPIVLKLNFNFNYYWIIYIFYVFIVAVIMAYSELTFWEKKSSRDDKYIGKAITVTELCKLLSNYKEANIIYERTTFGYKTMVYYDKKTNTITLT